MPRCPMPELPISASASLAALRTSELPWASISITSRPKLSTSGPSARSAFPASARNALVGPSAPVPIPAPMPPEAAPVPPRRASEATFAASSAGSAKAPCNLPMAAAASKRTRKRSSSSAPTATRKAPAMCGMAASPPKAPTACAAPIANSRSSLPSSAAVISHALASTCGAAPQSWARARAAETRTSGKGFFTAQAATLHASAAYLVATVPDLPKLSAAVHCTSMKSSSKRAAIIMAYGPEEPASSPPISAIATAAACRSCHSSCDK
mmetsp:Transcript_49848/g.126731  ORF Transcript_49848/g.126731 Transcript_49848/m.126731 type:complete len:268 (-) Transcript_49848:72-875(-)